MDGRRSVPIALSVLLASGCARDTPRDPGLVRLSLPYEVATLDPHARNAISTIAVASHLYDRLVDTDADLRLRPALAESWTTSDQRTWVFKLRPGVRFHDGRPLRAGDAVWSIQRLLRDSSLELSAYASYVSDVRATGPLTFEVRTRDPLSILLNRLRFVFIVPEGSDGAALAGKANGSGPYRLAEWDAGRRLRLLRNERYWGTAPALREVEILLHREPAQAADDLISGGARFAQCNSREAAQRLRAAGFALVRQPSVSVKYLGFGFGPATIPGPRGPLPNPFRRREVREAVHLALDRDRLVAGLPGTAVPATQPVPPSVFGFSPKVAPPVHDLERARERLRAAGLDRGFRATLSTRRIVAAAAEQVKQQLAPIGIDLDVQAYDDNEFLDRARRLEFALYVSRLAAVTGDATNLLENGLHTIDPERGMGVANFSGYSNREIDHAIEESVLLASPGPRRQALEAIMGKLMDDLPWAPLYVDEDVFALSSDLQWTPRRDGFVLAAEISLRNDIHRRGR
jgi:peptide/nickel transport system substrate-binding protein